MEALRVDQETVLVPAAVEHSAKLFAAIDANRAHLSQWLPWADRMTTVSDTTAFLETSVRHRDVGLAYVFLIERNDEIAGVVGLNRIDPLNRTANLGFWLTKDHQRQGIMTTACRTILSFGFSSCALNRVTARVATDNERSRHVVERLGFVHEGTFREAEWLHDHFVDHGRYAMLRRDWDSQASKA